MLLAYTFGLGLAFATLVVLIFVWVLVAVRIVRRNDIGVVGKVLWIVAILVIPLVGLLVYFLWDAARPVQLIECARPRDGEGGIRTLEAGIFPT